MRNVNQFLQPHLEIQLIIIESINGLPEDGEVAEYLRNIIAWVLQSALPEAGTHATIDINIPSKSLVMAEDFITLVTYLAKSNCKVTFCSYESDPNPLETLNTAGTFSIHLEKLDPATLNVGNLAQENIQTIQHAINGVPQLYYQD